MGEKSISIKIANHKQSPLPIAERLALSKRETASLLGVSERSLNNWVKEGKIVARKAGARLLFPMKALQDFLNGSDSTGNAE